MENFEVSIVKYICPICGNVAEEGIIMNSLLSEDAAKEVKNLNGKAIGYADHACKECAKYKGVYIIGIDESKSDDKNPWRTGNIVCIKEDSDLAKHLKNFILTLKDKTKFCFMDFKAGKEIGLWE